MKFSFSRIALAVTFFMLVSCAREADFTRVSDGRFLRHGQPYTFVGTNFWYGPSLPPKDVEGISNVFAKNWTP